MTQYALAAILLPSLMQTTPQHKTMMVWVYDKRPRNGSQFVYFGMLPVNPRSKEAQVLVPYAPSQRRRGGSTRCDHLKDSARGRASAPPPTLCLLLAWSVKVKECGRRVHRAPEKRAAHRPPGRRNGGPFARRDGGQGLRASQGRVVLPAADCGAGSASGTPDGPPMMR